MTEKGNSKSYSITKRGSHREVSYLINAEERKCKLLSLVSLQLPQNVVKQKTLKRDGMYSYYRKSSRSAN